mmetsp:Transcript_15807/g.40627  ORF Transcript_15807/g.40627 Transcript_15807/m.40627 type:complete len:103 (+) Transcript_15807:164-472(+)
MSSERQIKSKSMSYVLAGAVFFLLTVITSLVAYRGAREVTKPCSIDSDDAWAVGLATASSPDASSIIFSEKPAVTCANVKDTATSVVRRPSLIGNNNTWYVQ